MIIPRVHNFTRIEDYDGYNDYYTNPEYNQTGRRFTRYKRITTTDENEEK